MNRFTYIALGGIVAIVAGVLIMSYRAPAPVETTTTTDGTPQQAVLAGEYVCLQSSQASTTNQCKPGLKTDAGKYYAIDFNLSSQTEPPLVIGDRLEGSGLITPVEALSSNMWQQYNIVGILSITSARKLNPAPIAYACNADAKVCWDGSTVGRTGSDCQFALCPLQTATSSVVRTTLGQKMTGLNVSITPKEIVSDSRCPLGVQCVWAGTVEVRTVLETKVSHGEQTLTLGKPAPFGDYLVTLTEVTPAPKAGEKIAGSSYRFVFEVKKK